MTVFEILAKTPILVKIGVFPKNPKNPQNRQNRQNRQKWRFLGFLKWAKKSQKSDQIVILLYYQIEAERP